MTATLAISRDLALPLDFVVESTGVLAKKGAGKTNLGVVIVEETHRAGVPVVVIDPKGDWYGIRAGANGDPAGGLPIPVFGGEHGDIPLEPTAGPYLADLVREKGLSVVLDVSGFDSDAARRRFLTAFADRLYKRPEREPMLLMLEEAHEYIPQRVMGEDAKMVQVFERLVKQGRYKGIGVVMMTQRSASLNKDVLTQVDNLFMLRTGSPQDRAAVEAWVKGHGEQKAIIDSLPSLQTGEFWLWQPERGEPVHGRARMRSTYDAGATPKPGEKPRPLATLADVDLGAIEAAMAATIEKAKAEDPKLLREVEKIVEVSVLSDADRDVLSELDGMLRGLAAVIPLHTGILQKIASSPRSEPKRAIPRQLVPHESAPRTPSESGQPRVAPDRMGEARGDGSDRAQTGEVRFRAGAQRMIETLGRMHPLRLTKSQWGMVAAMKTTSGTWSTYFGEIKRAGFLDESSAGFTLTDAGFDYLGERPQPMSADELQAHYRKMLRAGAVRMLDAIMDAYPNVIDRETLGAAIEMSTSSGTFSTCLGELVRNGLADKVDGGLVATDILMKGAAA